MENVVQIENLAAFLEDTVAEVQRGLFKARQRGLVIEMPEEIDVTVIVIARDGFQALELQSTEQSTQEEIQGGEQVSKEVSAERAQSGGSSNSNETTSTTETQTSENAHNQLSEQLTTYTDVN